MTTTTTTATTTTTETALSATSAHQRQYTRNLEQTETEINATEDDAPIGFEPEWQKIKIYKTADLPAFQDATVCPEKVAAIGNIELLDTEDRLVSIITPANSIPKSIKIAEKLAEKTCQQKCSLVIGGTRSCEMPIIKKFLANGGNVIIILPMGIERFKMNVLQNYIMEGRVLIMALSLRKPWEVICAQTRNAIIAHLAKLLYVAECNSLENNSGTYDLIRAFKHKRIWIPAAYTTSPKVNEIHQFLVEKNIVMPLPNASTATEQIAITLAQEEEEEIEEYEEEEEIEEE